MSISSELMYAILAMDSYNRGYDPGVAGLSGENSIIGTATVKKDATQLLNPGEAQAAGFYAVAYEWNGETIISYRGTGVDVGVRPGSRATFVSAKVTKTIDAPSDHISGDGREEKERTNSLGSNKARVEPSARLRGRPAGVGRHEPNTRATTESQHPVSLRAT